MLGIFNKVKKALDEHKANPTACRTFTSVEEMRKVMDEETAKEKKEHPIKYWLEVFWLRHIVRHWDSISWFLFRDIPHRFEWGCSERDIWSFDYTLSIWAVKRLKALKHWTDVYGGTPSTYVAHIEGEPTEDNWKDAHGQWLKDIDKMIRAFELITEENNEIEDTLDDNVEKMKAYEEGMELFKKNIRNLWT